MSSQDSINSGETHGSTESSNSVSNETGLSSSTSSKTSEGNSSDEQQNNAPSPAPQRRRTPTKRMVQATELRFQSIEGRKSLARVAILLCNISDRPLYYKLKTDTIDLISALPSATGHIAARGSSRVVLTWQRPKHIKSWKGVASPKLLLVTRFLDETKNTTSTRLIAFMDPSTACPSDNPPIEQLMLDALSKTSGNDAEMTVTKSRNDSDPFADVEPQDPNVTLALIFLAIFIGICLYRALHPTAIVLR